jgi:hypothetical protein
VREDRLQRSLDDYLDDRMDAVERQQFEQRLAQDEQLARQLSVALEVRGALRSAEEDLPEAFYTRSRARFASAQRRMPFGLSWSTVGLAVATLAVAAVFVPSVLRRDLPDLPQTTVAQEEGRAQPTAEKIAAKKKGDVIEEEVADVPSEPPVPADRQRQVANEPAPPPVAMTAPPAESNILEVETEPNPVPQHPRLQTGRRESDLGKLNARVDERGADDANGFDEESDKDVATESAVGNRQRAAAAIAFELTVALAGAGEIEVFGPQDALQHLADAGKKESKTRAYSSGPATTAAENRFVAIGPRPGLDTCAELTLRRTEQAWEITYPDSGSSVGSVSCGIEIPDDGAVIHFQGWAVGE